VVSEADLDETETGLVPASTGWFVLSARDARWFQRTGRDSLPLTGCGELEAEDGPWGYYTVDETARRYGACTDVESQDTDVAYANVPPSQKSRYRDGALPG
jgi:hypothetical protein